MEDEISILDHKEYRSTVIKRRCLCCAAPTTPWPRKCCQLIPFRKSCLVFILLLFGTALSITYAFKFTRFRDYLRLCGSEDTIPILFNTTHGAPSAGETLNYVSISGVHIYQNVCLELNASTNAMQIVLYNSNENGYKNIQVAASHRVKHPHWVLQLKKGEMPAASSLKDGPAYFAFTTCYGNLFHFWDDTTLGLYGILKATKRLNAKTPNYLYYAANLKKTGTSGDGCHSLERYQDIILSLGFHQSHSGYSEAKPNTCFKNAVFGSYVTDNMVAGEAEKYVIDSMGISSEPCNGPRITIVNRTSSRRILNVQDLQHTAEEVGFSSDAIDIVSFEKLSLKSQMKTAWCSTVLVGIQGAGLTWLYFMKRPAALLEVTWHRWDSVYFQYSHEQNMCADTLNTHNYTVNWNNYSKHYRKPLLNETARAQAISVSSKYPFWDNHNVYKWADVYVDKYIFKKKLTRLVELLRKH